MQGVLQGQPAAQRRAMAKSITLLESTLPAHRVQADELLTGGVQLGQIASRGAGGLVNTGKKTNAKNNFATARNASCVLA